VKSRHGEVGTKQKGTLRTIGRLALKDRQLCDREQRTFSYRLQPA